MSTLTKTILKVCQAVAHPDEPPWNTSPLPQLLPKQKSLIN